MRIAGLVLFYLGVTAGAFVTVRELSIVTWWQYGITVAIAVAGVVLLRLTARGGATDQKTAAAELQVVHESLAATLAAIEALNAERERVGVYGIHGRIDADVMHDVNRFVEVRETIATVHGLDVYARTMDAFASGERALNRAWSASADGYVDEVHACLDRAERSVRRALDTLQETKAA
ncbi:MAG: hypothetical protein RIT81_46680 [Deltaproteobacteria bacterium]